MRESITIENNTLTISYSEKQPESSLLKLFNKNIDGIYYKENLMNYPYLSTQAMMLKLDDKKGLSDLKPFRFLIQEGKDKRADFNYMPHDFIFNVNIGKATAGEKVFEIRVKNKDEQWQNWQAIVGEFSIHKVVKQGDKIYLRFPIGEFIDEIKESFEIRFSGYLSISYFGDAQIIDEEDIKQINLNTREIEFFANSGNPCTTFEDRVNDWKKFEEKYFIYDEYGNRL